MNNNHYTIYERPKYSNDILSLCKQFYLFLELQRQIEARIVIVDLLNFASIFLYQFQAQSTNGCLFITVKKIIVQIIHTFVLLYACSYRLLQSLEVIS